MRSRWLKAPTVGRIIDCCPASAHRHLPGWWSDRRRSKMGAVIERAARGRKARARAVGKGRWDVASPRSGAWVDPRQAAWADGQGWEARERAYEELATGRVGDGLTEGLGGDGHGRREYNRGKGWGGGGRVWADARGSHQSVGRGLVVIV
jgi:hypothetical protein